MMEFEIHDDGKIKMDKNTEQKITKGVSLLLAIVAVIYFIFGKTAALVFGGIVLALISIPYLIMVFVLRKMSKQYTVENPEIFVADKYVEMYFKDKESFKNLEYLIPITKSFTFKGKQYSWADTAYDAMIETRKSHGYDAIYKDKLDKEVAFELNTGVMSYINMAVFPVLLNDMDNFINNKL